MVEFEMFCEAMAMDCGLFDNWDDPVPLCDETATDEVFGYSLCSGCAEALEVIIELGGRWHP